MVNNCNQQRVSLCILGCPETLSVNQTSLELTEICLLSAGIKEQSLRRNHHSTFHSAV
ncbi:hypothetical protein LEMLEM_LOCUS26727 [Lemmus lemmus]